VEDYEFCPGEYEDEKLSEFDAKLLKLTMLNDEEITLQVLIDAWEQDGIATLLADGQVIAFGDEEELYPINEQIYAGRYDNEVGC
jgi:hypothetical protein